MYQNPQNQGTTPDGMPVQTTNSAGKSTIICLMLFYKGFLCSIFFFSFSYCRYYVLLLYFVFQFLYCNLLAHIMSDVEAQEHYDSFFEDVFLELEEKV